MQLKRCLVVPLAVFLALQATGCGGPSKADVTGTVTLDGEPLYAGTIVFIPATGVAVSADIKSGNYTALQVPQGEVKVTVENNAIKRLAEQAKYPTPNRGGSSEVKIPDNVKSTPEAIKLQEQAEVAKRNQELIDKYRPVPGKYNDPNKTDLKFTVGTGKNQYNVPLTSQ